MTRDHQSDEDPFEFLATLTSTEREKFRVAFTAMLREAEEEADRLGTFTIEEVAAEMAAIIRAAKERRK